MKQNSKMKNCSIKSCGSNGVQAKRKQPIQASTDDPFEFEYMSREELIDFIEENYNVEEYYQDLEARIAKAMGVSSPEEIDDSTEEGIYAGLSDEQLLEIAKGMTDLGDFELPKLTFDEVSLLRELVEMATQASFIRSWEKARVAKRLLQKLQ